jgi:hypothetical protein
MAVTYFKAFDYRLKCRDMKYKVGETYLIPNDPKTGFPDIRVCSSGFHCCNRLFAVYDYYPTSATTRICVVKPGGIIRYRRHDGYRKIACSRMEIVRELTYEEILAQLEKEQKGYEDKGLLSVGMGISCIVDLLKANHEERERRIRDYRLNFGVRARKR